MEFVSVMNTVLGIVFFVCYFYQFVYIAVPFLVKAKPHLPEKKHTFALLISARNEEAVIGNLLDSIKQQDYPAQLVRVFVVADNCTDATAQAARNAGATVYERFDTEKVGKGYALDYLLTCIGRDFPSGFDGYMVFDADNVLEKNYITEMNRTFSDGHEVITGFRNSKNYGSNWISAGYALWFLRESSFLNRSRMRLNTSCTISGTGYMFSRRILDEIGGWPFHLLTEDVEFTAWLITHGYKVAYCEKAVLYDEQPVDFAQSWRQRMRWSRGFLQVIGKYGLKLLRSIFSRNGFSAYDISMTIMPAYALTITAAAVNCGGFVWDVLHKSVGALYIIGGLWGIFQGIYLTMFLIGGITVICEWKSIYCSNWKKILYWFTFPLFMATYIPISVAALFRRVEWKPIRHTHAVTLDEITKC